MRTNAPENNFPAPLKISACLFLPLFLIVEILHRLHFDPRGLMAAQNSFYFLTLCLPTLRHPSYRAMDSLLLVAAILTALFYHCPRDYKKPFLTLAAGGYIWCVLGSGYFLSYSAAVLLLWVAQDPARSQAYRWTLSLFGLGIAWYATCLYKAPLMYHAFGLTFFLSLKYISLFIDVTAGGQKAPFCDQALYLTGGFPCNFASPWYSYSGFTRVFLSETYWEMAKRGIISIYWGLVKIVLAFCCELWIVPQTVSFDFGQLSGHYYLSGYELWGYGLFGVVRVFLAFIGCYQILQGCSRLFGYNVQDQFRQPWFSISPLDFWRRYSVHNRAYLIKYVFYPFYRRWPNLGASILATFGVAAIINLMMYWTIWSAYNPWKWLWAARLAVYYGMFAIVCVAEVYVSGRGRVMNVGAINSLDSADVFRPLRQAGTFLLITLLMAPRVFRVYDSPPNLIQGRTLFKRYLFIYQRMLFLSWPKSGPESP